MCLSIYACSYIIQPGLEELVSKCFKLITLDRILLGQGYFFFFPLLLKRVNFNNADLQLEQYQLTLLLVTTIIIKL